MNDERSRSGTIVPLQAIHPGAPFHGMARKVTDRSQQRSNSQRDN
jgi:hypothetical protein